MKRLVLAATVFGCILTTTPAIAQTAPVNESQPNTSTEEIDLPPTENAGSADLLTSPARSTSSTLSDVSAAPISGTIQELRLVAPDVTLVEGVDLRSNGPANADHVQFVFPVRNDN